MLQCISNTNVRPHALESQAQQALEFLERPVDYHPSYVPVAEARMSQSRLLPHRLAYLECFAERVS